MVYFNANLYVDMKSARENLGKSGKKNLFNKIITPSTSRPLFYCSVVNPLQNNYS